MRYSIFLLFLTYIFIFGCGNDKSVSEDLTDTVSLLPQEVFSLTLTEDVLGEDDEDLKLFLEEEIYPLISKASKVTIDKIASSQYLLIYIENDSAKGLLLQKFYNPVKDEIEFTKTETVLTK
ncbi:MAG: hypothetical protein JW917_09910 [Ignavibacteria bacterium]|nr:hypothetical protein [Ignavibacteria bacterium]